MADLAKEIADIIGRLMAAGWRGNPHMSGDDRNHMHGAQRRRHDDQSLAAAEAVLSHLAARPVSAGEADASPAPAAMPSEEEIARAVCASDFDGDETVYDTLSSAQRLNFAINARAIAKLFAPILAEKERLSQKVRELALLLDRQMGTPCEQIRHHHAYADLTAIAEKRQDEADQQAARADAAEARALAAESALAAARGSPANAVDGSIDIRLDDKGGIDEIFGNGVLCHIERLSKGGWFIILTRPDQTQEAFWLNGKGKVEFTMHEHRTAPTEGPNVDPWMTAAAIRAKGE